MGNSQHILIFKNRKWSVFTFVKEVPAIWISNWSWTRTKFLGRSFDRKLHTTFKLCLKVEPKCPQHKKKCISHTEWVMLCLYGSLVRSKLDYGCIMCGSACKSYLILCTTTNLYASGLKLMSIHPPAHDRVFGDICEVVWCKALCYLHLWSSH